MKLKINNQDLGTIATIDTYQTFSFCAETVCDAQINDYNEQHDTDYDYDNFDWTYNNEQIAADLANASRQWFIDNAIGNVVKGIGLIEGTYSPREYNYQTDSWEAEWDIDEKALQDYVEANKEAYDACYRENGWSSHISWREDDDPKKRELIVLSMLAFYLNHEFNPEDYLNYMYEVGYEIYQDNITMKLIEEEV